VHKLLERQLQRLKLAPDGPAPPDAVWHTLLEWVGQAYTDGDRDRYMLERAIAISSEEMRVLHEHLRSERDKLRAIFESAALGILSIDEGGHILDANPAATRMLRRDREALIGTKLAPLFVGSIPPTLADASSVAPLVAERRYEHADGRTGWFNTTMTWVSGPDSASRVGTVIMEDVTERTLLEGSLRHAQKLESVGRLAAGIAHEINTPVQFINDNVHFLRDAFAGAATLVERLRELVCGQGSDVAARVLEAETVADWKYLVQEIPESINQTIDGLQRVTTIVSSMKGFAHNDRGEETPTDLNAALASTLVVAGHELKGVAIATTDFGVLPTVRCCRSDLNQVFLNLLVNAAHAIREVVGSSTDVGNITVTTRSEGDWVTIAIRDTGGGMPEDVAARMFEPFFTTKEVGRGSGQGLALARSIVVNKHHGTISFETCVGVGTTFTIRLPVAGVGSAVREAA
jgi:PAS domain S-box-containing protein